MFPHEVDKTLIDKLISGHTELTSFLNNQSSNFIPELWPWEERSKGKIPSARVTTIELMGFPGAGKSTFMEAAIKRYSNSRVRFMTYGEIGSIEQESPFARKIMARHFNHDELYVEVGHSLSLKKIGYAFNAWDAKTNKLLLDFGPKEQLFIFVERGAADLIAMEMAFDKFQDDYLGLDYRERRADKNMGVSGVPNERVMEMRKDALRYSFELDGIFLFGITKDESQKRRIRNNLSADGWIVNDKIWPYIDYGYSRFYQEVAPLLFKTSLKRINGELPIDQAHETCFQYIDSLLGE